ncbi:long-chain-fatty-acid--CoA ligase [Peribacillus asahii]|nr:long-chain fatty acid--CoA ligase [Peribacillus asahii]
MINLDNFSLLTLYEMLEQTAAKYPNQVAVIDGEIKLSYSELKETIDAFASVLYEKGIQKGDRIGLMLPNGIHYMISYYATQRLGGIVVQVNPLYQTSELQYMLDDANPKLFICGRNQAEKLEKIEDFENVHVIFTKDESNKDQILLKGKNCTLPPLNINPNEDVAVLQYTGGTTGRSKGVMLTHFNIISNIHQSGSVVSSVMKEGEERILGVAPLTHAMAMTNMNYTVRFAATYIIVEKFEVTKVLQTISQYKPTMMLGSPTMYIALLNHPNLGKNDLSCFKICISGSAPLPVEVLKELERKSGAHIFEGYGLSEATTSTHRTPVDGERKIGSVGIPVPLTESKIVDIETGTRELATGERGELIVKGPQVMKGYWNKSVETALTIRDGWLYTGDIAVRDKDGYYYIVGRKKDMVIAGGLNIYPAEVEEMLYQHPAIAEACVFGVPDAYLGEKLLAIVILKQGENISEQELLSWCEGRIARYKIPRAIEFREALPKTIVGKILRRRLVEEYKEKLNQL